MEKCQRKKCDAVGMVRNEKKGKFSHKKLGDFFRGVVYRGTCVWELLGGTFGGNAKKGVEKLFGGSVGGALNPNKFQGGIF